MKTKDPFLIKYAPMAVASMKASGIPASVTLAQAWLESGRGKSQLTKLANNFFGIKGKGPLGSVYMRTREVVNGHSIYINAPFRKYKNAEESFTDHAEFLHAHPRYKKALACHLDGRCFARALQAAGYATDPKYAQTLIKLIDQNGLDSLDV